MTRKEIVIFLPLIIAAFLLGYNAYGGETDSLQSVLQLTKSDSVKGLIYLQLAKKVSRAAPVIGVQYLNKGLSLGTSVGPMVRAELEMELGNYQRLTGDYTNAVKNILAALAVFEKGKYLPIDSAEKRKYLQKEANCYNNLGIAYFTAGNLGEAEIVFTKALNQYRQIGDEVSVATVLNNIGELYQRRGDPKAAEKYYHQAYSIALSREDFHMQSVLMNNFGDTNYNLKKYSRAIYFQTQALRMANDLNDVEGISYSYIGLAKAYNKFSIMTRRSTAHSAALELLRLIILTI